MLQLSRTADTHEDLFIQRYQALVAFGLRLSDNDTQQAEDLVQDAFVAFTLSRPELAGIESRRLSAWHAAQAAVVAHPACGERRSEDSVAARSGLRGAGAARRGGRTVEATQELLCVCRYACLRKASSKAGSILILRFFHGYFPSEIARIARITPRAVDDWLRIARREARLFREEPHRLRFLKRPEPSASVDALDAIRTGGPAECLLALRNAMFHAHEGRCFTRRELAHFYAAPATGTASLEALEASRRAHVVSCRRCLERINVLLDLGSLDDRSPHDMLGPNGSADSGVGGSRSRPRRAPRTPSAGCERRCVARRHQDERTGGRTDRLHDPPRLADAVRGADSARRSQAREQRPVVRHAAARVGRRPVRRLPARSGCT